MGDLFEVPARDAGSPAQSCEGAQRTRWGSRIKSGNLLLAALLLTACGNADRPEVPDVPDAGSMAAPEAPALPEMASADDFERGDFSADLASSSQLELGMDIDDAEPILRASVTDEGEGVRGSSVRKIYAIDGRTILIATQNGMGDDSVDSFQTYAEFVPISPLQTSLEFYGRRIKCARGSNTENWTTEPCP